MWIVLGKVIFDLLHHLEEVFEANQLWVILALCLSLPDLAEQLLSLLGIPLETLHDCLQVLDVYAATLLLVKEVENLFQVLDLLVRKLHLGLVWIKVLLHLIVQVLVLAFNERGSLILLLLQLLIHL